VVSHASQIPGGPAVSVVGIINGAINGMFSQVLAVPASLGIVPPT
jgi:hypothetical protein